jgi:hypothetical protein
VTVVRRPRLRERCASLRDLTFICLHGLDLAGLLGILPGSLRQLSVRTLRHLELVDEWVTGWPASCETVRLLYDLGAGAVASIAQQGPRRAAPYGVYAAVRILCEPSDP